jgi:hypothetical protein
MTITDIEIIEHLDFDFAPPCEANPPIQKDKPFCNHEAPAVWKVVSTCCGKVKLSCDECLQWRLDYHTLYCTICNFSASPGRNMFALIERL